MSHSGQTARLALALSTWLAVSSVAYCQYRDVVRTAANNATTTVMVPILPTESASEPAASDPNDDSTDVSEVPAADSSPAASTSPAGSTPPSSATPPTADAPPPTPAYAPATPATSAPPALYTPANPGEVFPPPAAVEGTTPNFTPAPPPFNPGAIAPLPSLAPVPYYSNLFGQSLSEPPLAWFEEPGLKQGWLFSAGTGFVKPYIHSTESSAGLAFSGLNSHPAVPVFSGMVQLPVAQPELDGHARVRARLPLCRWYG